MNRICFAFAVVCSPICWADWPAFRGPNGAGNATAKALPVEWTQTKNVLWRQALTGEGWSSPVVVGERIYLTTAVPKTAGDKKNYSLRAGCRNLATGSELWDVEVFQEDAATAPPIHGKNSHASPTPLVAGDRLFVHFGHEGTACLDLNGKVLWRNRSLRYPPRHGAGGTPILVDGKLIFSCDGETDPFIVALDANSGAVVWKSARETNAVKKFSFCTATLIEVSGRKQIISPGSNMVCALEPADGKEIWRVRYDGYSVIPKPVFGHGMVFISTSYDAPKLLAIRVDGHGDVTDSHVAWTSDRGAPHTPSLQLVGNDLFMISDRGIATCLDARTGQLAWQERVGGNFSASPVAANGRLYLVSEEGKTTVLAVSRTFRKLAENELQERALASLAVAGDSLLFRTDKHLYRIGSK